MFIVGGTTDAFGFHFKDDEVVTLTNTIIAENRALGYWQVNSELDHKEATKPTHYAARYENTHDVWFSLPGTTNSNFPDPIESYHSLSVESANNIIGIGINPSLIDSDGHYDYSLPIEGINGNQIGTLAMPIDPGLAPLADYGGPTQTRAIFVGVDSPALDAGLDLNLIRPVSVESASYRSDTHSAYNLISEAVTLAADDVVDAADPLASPPSNEDIDRKYWASPPPPGDDSAPDDSPEPAFVTRELQFGFHTVRQLNSIVLWEAGRLSRAPNTIEVSFSADGGKSWGGTFQASLNWGSNDGTGLSVGFGASSWANAEDYVAADKVRLQVLGNEGEYQTALSEVRFGGKALHDQRGGPFNRQADSKQVDDVDEPLTDIGAYESQPEHELWVQQTEGGQVDFSGHAQVLYADDYELVVSTTTDEIDLMVDPADLSLREAILLANLHSGVQRIALAESLTGSTIMLQRGELRISDSTTIAHVHDPAGEASLVTIDASGSYNALPEAKGYLGADLPGRADLYGNPDTPHMLAEAGAFNVLGSRIFNIDDGFERGQFFIARQTTSGDHVDRIDSAGNFLVKNHSLISLLPEFSNDYRYEIRNVVDGSVQLAGQPVTDFEAGDFEQLVFVYEGDPLDYSAPDPSFEIHRIANVTIESVGLTGGLVQGSGGAIRTVEDLTLKNSDIYENNAHEVYESAFNLTVMHASAEFFHEVWLYLLMPEIVNPSGGGVYAERAVLTIESSRVFDNGAVFAGGGVAVKDGRLVLADGSEVRENVTRRTLHWTPSQAAAVGGGVAIINSYGETASSISNSTIQGNVSLLADDYYLAASGEQEARATQGSFAETDEHGTYGGGLFLLGAELEISNVEISENEAWQGGGVFIAGAGASPFLQEFHHPILAEDSGDRYKVQLNADKRALLKMINTTVSGNRAVVRLDEGSMETNRRAYGGGVAADGAADLSISFSTITENVALKPSLTSNVLVGGGVFFPDGPPLANDDGEWPLKVDHSVIASNFAASPANVDTSQAVVGQESAPPPVYSDVLYKGTSEEFLLTNSLIGDNSELYVPDFPQTELTDRWDLGGVPKKDTVSGNLIGGRRIGEDTASDEYYAGVLDPKLDVLAYNAGPTQTHLPLVESLAPLALILPTLNAHYHASSDNSFHSPENILADPIAGFNGINVSNSWYAAEVMSLPLSNNRRWLLEPIRNNSWVSEATQNGEGFFQQQGGVSNPVFDFNVASPDVAYSKLSQVVVWSAKNNSYSDPSDEVKAFTLEFYLGGATEPHVTLEFDRGALPTDESNAIQRGGSQVFDFGQEIDADRVVFTVTDNFSDEYSDQDSNGDRVALGQIRFVGQMLDADGASSLPTSSPLINAGSGMPDDAPANDQRGVGYARYVDTIDIGATEAGAHPTDNGPPAIKFTSVVSVLSEDIDTTDGVRIADIVVSNHKNAPLSFAISGHENDLFEVRVDDLGRQARELWLKPGAELSFETLDVSENMAARFVDVSILVTDASLTPASSVIAPLPSVQVLDINDRPMLVGGVPSLTLARDATPQNNLGVKVFDLLLNASDEDLFPTPDGPLGLAVVGVSVGAAENSAVEYSLDAGATWFAIAGIPAGEGLLLESDARLRFNLQDTNSDRIEDAISFRVWDRTEGVAAEMQPIEAIDGSLSLLGEGDAPFTLDVVVIPRLGDPFTVSESQTSAVPDQADVAVDVKGYSIHAWREVNATASNEIKVRRVDPDGVVVGVPVSVTLDDTASNPRVITTPDGGAIVVWEADSGGINRLFASRLTLAGDMLDSLAPSLLSTSPVSDGQRLTSVSLASSDANETEFLVMWEDGVSGQSNGVDLYLGRYRHSFANNSIIEVAKEQIDGVLATDQRQGKVSVSSDGASAYVAWIEGAYEVRYGAYSLDGGGLVPPGSIENVPTSAPEAPSGEPTFIGREMTELRLTPGPNGEALLGWVEDTDWQLSGGSIQRDAQVYAVRLVGDDWVALDYAELPAGEASPVATVVSVDGFGESIHGLGLGVDDAGRAGLLWVVSDSQDSANSLLVSEWLDAEGAVTGGPFEQVVAGQWVGARLGANGSGRFVYSGTRDTDGVFEIAAQRFGLGSESGYGFDGVAGLFEVEAGDSTLALSVASYGGLDYVAFNGVVTDAPVSEVYSLSVVGTPDADVIDLRGLSGTALENVPVLISAGDGADEVYVGAGDSITIDGGLGDDTYIVTDQYSTTVKIVDAGGDDTLHLIDWQDSEGALVVLGHRVPQLVTRGGGAEVTIDLETGQEIESVTSDGSPSELFVFSPEKRVTEGLETLEVNSSLDIIDQDHENVTLREALLWAKTDVRTDVITIAAGVGIYLTETLVIDSAVSIEGPSPTEGQAFISGTPNATGDPEHRIFEIAEGVGATIKHLTLRDGLADGSDEHPNQGGAIYAGGSLTLYGVVIETSSAGATGMGGGIAFSPSGQGDWLRVYDSVIQGNDAASGAGVYAVSGRILISSSALLENGSLATVQGGGLHITTTANVEVINSTIADNLADSGGGVYVSADAVHLPRLVSSTLADNRADDGGALYAGREVEAHGVLFARNTKMADTSPNTIFGDFESTSSYNLVDAGGAGNLDSLSDNFGPEAESLIEADRTNGAAGTAPYYALSASSPAKNKIPIEVYNSNHPIPVVDQRGYVPMGATEDRDIGAYEFGGEADMAAPTLSPLEGYVDESAIAGTVVSGFPNGKVEGAPTWRNYTYEIVHGDPYGAFAIDPSSGVITVADGGLLNAELVPSYLLTVQVTETSGDPPRTAYGVVRIAVVSVNERPYLNGPYDFEVTERAYDGDAVGVVSAIDPEGDELSYALDDPSGALQIDAQTGEVTIKERSKLTGGESVSFTVTALEVNGSTLTDTADGVLYVRAVGVPARTTQTDPVPPADFSVSHAGELLGFNPVASFANIEGSDYRVEYSSGGRTIGVDYSVTNGVQAPSGSLGLSLGTLSVRPDGALDYKPYTDLVEQGRLTSPGPGGDYYYEDDSVTYRIIALDGSGQPMGELVAPTEVQVRVTNHLPIFRSDFVHREGDLFSLNHRIEVLPNALGIDTKYYQVDLNDLFYDPDGDSIEVIGLANPNARTHSGWDVDDEPDNDAGEGSIWAVVSSKSSGGSAPPMIRRLWVETAEDSGVVQVWQDGRTDDGSMFSNAHFGTLTFMASVTDGQTAQGEAVSFDLALDVFPRTGSGHEQGELGPVVDLLRYTPNGDIDTEDLLIDPDQWGVTATDFTAGREGRRLQQVGDATVDIVNGALLRRHGLILDGSGGASDIALPGLIYDSSTADPNPAVEVSLDTQEIEGETALVSAEFTWYDHIVPNGQDDEVNTVVVTQAAQSVVLDGTKHSFLFQPNGENDSANDPYVGPQHTGVYHWEVKFTVVIDHDGDPEQITITESGDTPVVVQKAFGGVADGNAARPAYSPQFGDGWALEGVPQLFIDDTRSKDIVPDPDDEPGLAVLSFSGEAPRVFKTPAPDGTRQQYDEGEFTPVNLETGLTDPLEFGRLRAVTRTLPDFSEKQFIEYKSADSVFYEFERSESEPVWRLIRIVTPASPRALEFRYESEDFSRIEQISATDGTAVTFDGGSIELDDLQNVELGFIGNNLETVRHILADHDHRVRSFGYDSGRMTSDEWSDGGDLVRITSFVYDGDDNDGDNDDVDDYLLKSVEYGTSDPIKYTVTPLLRNVADSGVTERVAAVELAAGDLSQNGDWHTEYEFDAENNVVAERRYFGAGPSAATLISGEAWAFDHLGSALSYTDELDRVTYFTYDYQQPVNAGLRNKTVDNQQANSFVALYDEDDFRGNVVRIDSLAGSSLFAYETADKAKSALGLLVMTVDPAGLVTKYKRNTEGQVTELTIGEDYLEKWKYTDYETDANLAWLLEEHVSPLGLVTTYSYDSDSRRVTSAEAVDSGEFGETIHRSYAYDNVGFLESEIVRSGSDTGPVYSHTQYVYDESGQLRSRRVFDEEDPGVNDEPLEVMIYGYDPDGLTTSETRGDGVAASQVSYEYDKRGLLTHQRIDRDKGDNTEDLLETIYTYYSDGSLKSTTSPDGAVQSLNYYPNDRKQETVTEANDNTGVAVGTAYETDDGPVVTTYQSATLTQEFDAAGRLLESHNDLLQSAGEATTYSYDDVRHDTPTRVSEFLTLDLEDIPQLLTTQFSYDIRGDVVYEFSSGGAGRFYKYDPRGNLTEARTGAVSLGSLIAYEHDAVGAVTLMTEHRSTPGESEVTEIETERKYDQSGRLRRVVDVVKGVASADPNEAAIDYAFEQLNLGDGLTLLRKVTSTSRDGRTTNRFIDAAGRVVQDINEYGGETTYVYDTAGNLTSTTEHAPNVDYALRIMEYEHDGLGRTTKATQQGVNDLDADAIETITRYIDKSGDEGFGQWDIEVTGPNGVARTNYDSLGNLVATRQGGSQEASDDLLVLASYDYNHVKGVVAATVRTTSPRGEVDLATGAGVHDETSVRRTISNARGGELLVADRLNDPGTPQNELADSDDVSEADFLLTGFHQRVITTYGEHGLVKSRQEGDEEPTTYQYDFDSTATGQVIKVQYPNHTVDYKYDSSGNRVSQTQTRVSSTEGESPTEHIEWRYDHLGRIIAEETTAYVDTANPNEAVIRSWTYVGLETNYEDRNDVQITTVLNPANPTSIETATYFAPGTTTLISVTTTTRFNRDGSIREVVESWSGGNRDGHYSMVTYQYDEYGRVASTSSDVNLGLLADPFSSELSTPRSDNGIREEANWLFAYNEGADTPILDIDYATDPRGRVVGVTQAFAGGAPWEGGTPASKGIGIDYNANGTRDKLHRLDGAGSIISFTGFIYDGAGRLTDLTHFAEEFDAVEPNLDVLASYEQVFDDSDRLGISRETFYYWDSENPGETPAHYQVLRREHLEYEYDEDGNPTVSGPALDLPIGSYNNPQDELATESSDASFNEYDSVGNRISNKSEIGYGNRLVIDAQYVYEYDRQGNLTLKHTLAGGVNGPTWDYSWDHKGRLLEVQYRENGAAGPVDDLDYAVTYGYDALGRQVLRHVDYQDAAVADETTGYLWDGASRQFEFDASNGNLTRSYFTGAGGEMLAIDEAGATTWLFTDRSDTVRMLGQYIPQSGPDAEHWRVSIRAFDPFGQPAVFPKSGRTELHRLQNSGDVQQAKEDGQIVVLGNEALIFAQFDPVFQGGYWDDFAGLYDLNGRWYDPFSGRYVQDAGGMNGYAFSKAAPNRNRVSAPSDVASISDTYGYYLNPLNNDPGENLLFGGAKVLGWTMFVAGSVGGGIVAGGTALTTVGWSSGAAYGLSTVGAAAGSASAALQTWAGNPDAGFAEYAFAVGIGGGFGGLSPISGIGELAGSGIGYGVGGRTGLQIGGLAGGLVGAGVDDGVRAFGKGAGLGGAAWHATRQVGVTGAFAGGAGAAAYGYTGDVNTALLAANLASIPGNLAAQRLVPCFPAGTPVLTPEGHKPIEELRPGDLVLSRDEHNDGTATPTPQAVEEVFVREGRLLELTVAGHTLRTTPEHPFYEREQGWTAAGELAPGDQLSDAEGGWLTLDRVNDRGKSTTVYNFRVSEYHTYFIAPAELAFDVWVHNTYADARVLRANLIARGKTAVSGDQAAHLVPTGAFSNRIASVRQAVADAQGILARRGIDLNSHRNGFFSDLANHYGTHRDKFLLEMGERLRSADAVGLKAVLKEIKVLKADVINGAYI